MSSRQQQHSRNRGGTSRNVQAFEALFEPQDDVAPHRGRGDGSRRRRSGRGSELVRGFRLREDAEPSAAAPSLTSDDRTQLLELFGASLPADLIIDVYLSCGSNIVAATELLLSMSSGDGGNCAQQAAVDEVDTLERQQQQLPRGNAGGSSAPARGPCWWDELPQECRELVFEHLTLREMAVAARTCQEWAAYARTQRSGLSVVRVPRDVTHTTLRGLVAAFGAAEEVDLSRWRDTLKFPHSFEAAFRAIALGECDRRVLTGVPVTRLVLARCAHMTDADIACMLSTLPHLVAVDLSHCRQLSDAAITMLARYSREAEGEGAENEEEDAAKDAANAAGPALSEQMQQLAMDDTFCLATPRDECGTRGSNVLIAPPATLESPNTAVRRIAAQLRSRQAAAAAVQQQHLATRAGLQELRLRGTSITAKGIKALLAPGTATVRSLAMLDVSSCPNLGGDGLDVPPRAAALRVLRASGCHALRSVIIQLPNASPLEELVLDGCRQLNEVILVAPRLRTLSLSHCGVLASLSLRCKRLETLTAVNCSALNPGGGALFECPELRSLNMFGCRALNAEGMEAIAANTHRLSSLDVSGCIALPRLQLPDAPMLERVALDGCAVLRVVSLVAPQLCELRAKGCVRLMELRLFSAVLRRLNLENCSNLREANVLDTLPAIRGIMVDAAGSASRAAAESDEEDEPGRALVLRGCAALPDATRQRLRAAVLRER